MRAVTPAEPWRCCGGPGGSVPEVEVADLEDGVALEGGLMDDRLGLLASQDRAQDGLFLGSFEGHFSVEDSVGARFGDAAHLGG